MTTSGNEYFIGITSGITKSSIWLHHYYHPQAQMLTALLNAWLPEEDRIRYLPADTKQDCTY